MGRIVDLCGEIAAAVEEGSEGLFLPPDDWERLRQEWTDEDIEDALGFVRESLLQSELVESADSLSARLVEVLGQFSDAPAGATSSQILGGSTLREMHQPVNMAPDLNSGFGIGFAISRVANLKVIGHSGSVPGYRTNIGLVPVFKLGVVVFTNTTTDPIAITEKLLGTLIPTFEHQSEEPQATPEQIAAWKPYLGRYDWPTMDAVLDVRIYKNRLTALTVGEGSDTFVTLRPDGEHQFKMIGGHSANEPLRFEVDADGKVTGLWFGPYHYRRIEEES